MFLFFPSKKKKNKLNINVWVWKTAEKLGKNYQQCCRTFEFLRISNPTRRFETEFFESLTRIDESKFEASISLRKPKFGFVSNIRDSTELHRSEARLFRCFNFRNVIFLKIDISQITLWVRETTYVCGLKERASIYSVSLLLFTSSFFGTSTKATAAGHSLASLDFFLE